MDYKKTFWVDGETPVNAQNMNKIEDAIQELADTSLKCSNLEAGEGISISSSCGKVTISQETWKVPSAAIVMEDGNSYEEYLKEENAKLRAQIIALKAEIERILEKLG